MNCQLLSHQTPVEAGRGAGAQNVTVKSTGCGFGVSGDSRK